MVPPAQFIPLAEELGLIRDLGDWVLTRACAQLRAFRKQGLKLPRVAINISAFEFDETFALRVLQVLKGAELEPANDVIRHLDILDDGDQRTQQY